MPDTTTRAAIPYPLGTDPPDTDGDLRKLAERVDTVAALDAQGLLSARPTTSVRGSYYYAMDTGVLFRHTGSAWVALNEVKPASFSRHFLFGIGV